MPKEPLVDAEALLNLTRELRAIQERIETADVTDDQRQRWQGTLGRIAEGASADLEKARAQVRRLSGQVDRALGSA